jgi:zinc transporter ZupT
MRRPLSPNRRKAAALAGAAAALSGSLSVLHQHQPADVSDFAFGGLVGLSIGAMLAASIVLLIRDRRSCSRQ